MIKIIFDSYMGPCLSPIKYGTTHDKYLKYSAEHALKLKGSRGRSPLLKVSGPNAPRGEGAETPEW